MNKNENRFLKTGQIYKVDFPDNNGFCLKGTHPCVVIKRFGSTVQVVPISSNRNNLHHGEIPIKCGCFNLNKASKIKLCQWTSVSIDRFKEKIGIIDKETIRLITNFIKKDIIDFMNKAA